MSQLTYNSDVLPAIAGIAKHLQGLTGATYLAGIFKPEAYFEAHLAWKCVSPQTPRRSPPRAPSWSWASVDNPVVLNPAETTYSQFEESGVACLESKIRILDAQVTPSPTESLRYYSGTLLVEGHLTKCAFDSDRKELALDGRPVAMELFLDEPLIRDSELFILPLLVIPAFHPDLELGSDLYIHLYLILAVTAVETDTYTRVGLGRFESEWEEDPMMTGTFMRTEGTNRTWPSCEDYIGKQLWRRIRIV